MSLDNAELVKLALKSDDDAFMVLWLTISPDVREIVRKYLRNYNEDIKDVMQDVFIAAWQDICPKSGKVPLFLSQYPTMKNFRTRVYTIAIHRCCSFLKEKKRSVFIYASNAERAMDAQSYEKYEDVYADSAYKEKIEKSRATLNELSESLTELRQEILRLFDEGKKVKEIAQVLKKSPETISNHLYHIRRQLQSERKLRQEISRLFDEGKEAKEIAQVLEKSSKTISNHLYYIRRQLERERELEPSEKTNKTLRCFLLLPFWLWDIMRPIANGMWNSTLISKPLAPWMVPQSAVALGVLIVWWSGIGQPTPFQPPDSLAGPEVRILPDEHKKPPLMSLQVNWAGEESEIQENDSAQKTAVDPQLEQKNNNGVSLSTKSEESWTKATTGIPDTATAIEDLVSFRSALYTVTDDGIIKSVNNGDSWGPVNDGLVAGDEATLTFPRTYVPFIGWDGPKLKVSGDKLYVATSEGIRGKWNPGIYCLTDNGSSWTPIQRNMKSANGEIHVVSQLAITGGNVLRDWGRAALPLESGRRSMDETQSRDFGSGQVGCIRRDCLRFEYGWETFPFG